jgi:centromeric protein E
MSTTLPRPVRPAIGGPPLISLPPTSALPALPVGKTRKSTETGKSAVQRQHLLTPKSGLRAPSASVLPSPAPAPTRALPQPRAISTVSASGKTLRKAVSINSFPHPPRPADGRTSSLPPSPLSADISSSLQSKRPTTLNDQAGTASPSLLTGTGAGKSATRYSDGVVSVSSLPQSRSSSAQGSYSTSATQYEDNAETSQHTAEAPSGKRSSKTDGKGNVVVSVRIRPDAGFADNKGDREWMVDERRSHISYRAKEGGEYYYGEFGAAVES